MMAVPVWADTAEEVQYDAHGKRDPFIALVSSASGQPLSGLFAVETLEDLQLEGVVYDPKMGSVVIVNGTVMREGEEQGNVKLLKIQPEGAAFLVNGVEGFRSVNEAGTAGKSGGLREA